MSTVLESAATELVPLAPKPVPLVALSPFNRMFLDRKDPVDGTGMELAPFCYALTYAVPPEKHAAVVESLYRRIYARLGTNSVPLANPSIVDYDDARTGASERARRYVIARGDTIRDTHMDVFATFRSYGEYLYVAVSSFMLPRLSLMRMAWAYLVALGVTWWAWLPTGPIGWLFVTCPLLLWWNRDVIRSLRHGDPLRIALRRHYFSLNPSGTFDNDDALAYFKCTLTLITEETTAVFRENGIQVEELQQIQQNIKLTTKLSNRGTMNVLGSMLVGAGNAVGGGDKK